MEKTVFCVKLGRKLCDEIGFTNLKNAQEFLSSYEKGLAMRNQISSYPCRIIEMAEKEYNKRQQKKYDWLFFKPLKKARKQQQLKKARKQQQLKNL